MAGGRNRRRSRNRRMTGLYDHTMLLLIFFLVGFGLVMIYSTSSYAATVDKGHSMFYLKRQGLMAVMGIFAMLLLSKLDYRFWMKRLPGLSVEWPTFLLWLSVILQLYVLFFGVELNGAKRWISLGPLGTFQPSDFAKIAIILYVANLIHRNPRELDTFKGFVKIAALPVVDVALIGKENMSTAIVLILIIGGMCFIASKNRGYYFIIILIAIVGILAVLFLGEGFRMQRVNTWLNLEKIGINDQTYQIMQGLYAIAAGGIFGKGLGQSTQKLGYVPEAQNDWIFSIICEELGIFGACCIILVFILLLWRMVQIAVNAPDLFSGMVCTGVIIHIAAQVLINVAVVTNSMPSTGVALPFISYGGTSVAMLLAEMGLVLSVSNRVTID